MKKIDIEETFKRLEEKNPEPKTELNFNSAFQFLIAVILSAQTTDKAVNKVTFNLFNRAPCAASLAKMKVVEVEKIICEIGLYKKKAKFIIKTANLIIQKHNGVVPANRKELEKLPGVGRKTAGVVLNTIYSQCEIGIDTHILRVSGRLGIVNSKNVNKLESQLIRVVPDRYKLNAHNLLLLHGRYICKARKPKCTFCFLTDLCNFGKQNGVIN